jgi:flavodoxin
MKAIVVYYSRTGTCRKVSETISNLMNADNEEIYEMKNREGAINYIIGGYDAVRRNETNIKVMTKDPAHYDNIIICSPVWAGKMTPAIRTYVNKYKNSFKKVALIAISGGGNSPGFKTDFENTTGVKTTSYVEIQQKDIKNDKLDKLKDFIKTIS